MSSSISKKALSPLKITQAYQGFLDEPIPSTLFDAVVSGKANRILKISKTILLLLTGYLAAVMIATLNTSKPATFDQAISIEQLAVSAHSTFANDAVYPVQVGVDDINHLSTWLAYRSDMFINIPQLATLDYTLIGGNIIPDSGNISAMLVYENDQGSKLSVLFRDALFEAPLADSNSGKLDNFHWVTLSNQQKKIVIVSELEQSELQSVAKIIQR